MNRNMHTLRTVLAWTMAGLCLQPELSAGWPARIRLHDATRDDAAQKAAEAARKISNSSLFQKELANLEAMAQLEIDSVFRGEARETRALIDEIVTNNWQTMNARIAQFQTDLKTVDDEARSELNKTNAKIQADKARIEALKKNAPTPAAAAGNPADAVAKVVGQAVDADTAAGAVLADLKLKGKAGQSATQLSQVVGKALNEADSAAKTVAANQQAVVDVKAELAKLATDLTGLSIQRISLEIEDLQAKKDIYDRQVALDKSLTNLASGYTTRIRELPQEEDIVKTIQEAAADSPAGSRARLEPALSEIFTLAAIVARWKASGLITQLRLAHAEHRASIRRSQLEAHAYEVAIGNGAQRLALFYRGGIHPETIAQLIYTFSTAAIPWAIKTN